MRARGAARGAGGVKKRPDAALPPHVRSSPGGGPPAWSVHIDAKLVLELLVNGMFLSVLLASLFTEPNPFTTDCSVIDPYDCVARPGCGW